MFLSSIRNDWNEFHSSGRLRLQNEYVLLQPGFLPQIWIVLAPVTAKIAAKLTTKSKLSFKKTMGYVTDALSVLIFVPLWSRLMHQTEGLGVILSHKVNGIQTSMSLEAVYPGDRLTQRRRSAWPSVDVSTYRYSLLGCPLTLWSDHAGGVDGRVGCRPDLGNGGMLQQGVVVASAGSWESGIHAPPQQTRLQWISDYWVYLISSLLWGQHLRHTYISIRNWTSLEGWVLPFSLTVLQSSLKGSAMLHA